MNDCAKERHMTVKEAWDRRRELFAEGDRLYVEGRKLSAAFGRKLYVESDKLYAECRKLYAECSRLRAEGDLIFYKTVIERHGNVEIKWEDRNATVWGIRYEWEPNSPCEGKVVEIDGRKYRLTEVK